MVVNNIVGRWAVNVLLQSLCISVSKDIVRGKQKWGIDTVVESSEQKKAQIDMMKEEGRDHSIDIRGPRG